MNSAPHRIVLLGVGHTHAEIVRRWARSPRPGTRLVCISDHPRATYSGMLPGTVAGQYRPQRMTIDLERLCRAARAEFHVAQTTGIDVSGRRIRTDRTAEIPFDVLSIGIGSRPSFRDVARRPTATLVEIKPMQTFLERLDGRLTALEQSRTARPWRIAVVGGGAAGVEIACCLTRRLAARATEPSPRITLFDRGDRLLPGLPDRAARLLRRRLDELGIERRWNRSVEAVGEAGLEFAEGPPARADLIIWATGAVGPPLLGELDLPRDERGFLLTDDTLRVTGELPVFAVGDSGSLRGHPLPKAGLYAVRQAPVLWDNLHRLLDGQPLRDFRPQRRFLKLLNTGDGKAVLIYRGWSFHARWCWWLKDAIDRRFVSRYSDIPPSHPPV